MINKIYSIGIIAVLLLTTLPVVAQTRGKIKTKTVTCRITDIYDKLPPDAAVLHGTNVLIILTCNTPRKATILRIKADHPNAWPQEWDSPREVGATFRAELIKGKLYSIK